MYLDITLVAWNWRWLFLGNLDHKICKCYKSGLDLLFCWFFLSILSIRIWPRKNSFIVVMNEQKISAALHNDFTKEVWWNWWLSRVPCPLSWSATPGCSYLVKLYISMWPPWPSWRGRKELEEDTVSYTSSWKWRISPPRPLVRANLMTLSNCRLARWVGKFGRQQGYSLNTKYLGEFSGKINVYI